MKKTLFISAVLMLAVSCIVYVPRDQRGPGYDEPYEGEYRGRQPYGEMDVGYFYDHLDGYGYWVYHSPYGHVWIPHATEVGWRPFTHGRWLWTDYGWTWFSDFDWGWAPFHYGRWGWDNYLGWYWVPGTIWGPAWVTWRWGDIYIGWAPLPPDVRFRTGYGISTLPYRLNDRFWVFLDGRNFYNRRLYNYIFPYERNVNIITYTTLRTNIVVQDARIINSGIDLDYARRVTRQRISKYELQNSRRAGPSRVEAGTLNIYRPDVKANTEARPREVVEKSAVLERVTSTRLKKSGTATTQPSEQMLRERQEREVRILEESQKKEARQLEEKAEIERREAKSAQEKQKVEKAYKEKTAKMKSKHQEEQSKIKERHTSEKKKTTSKVTRKKKKK